jgi:hypothetical protein
VPLLSQHAVLLPAGAKSSSIEHLSVQFIGTTYRHDSRQKGHVVLGESDAVGDKRIRDMGGLLGSESTWFQLSYEKISS